MNFENPLQKSKQEYKDTIDRIKSDAAVGIDAQYTHAIIITYLRNITTRLNKIEAALEQKSSSPKKKK